MQITRLNHLGQGKVEAPKIDPLVVQIRPGYNYRDTTSEASKAHIAYLKESIRAIGVQEPILVEFVKGEVFLVDGECRLIAAQSLRRENLDIRIPAIGVDTHDEAIIRAKSMVANGALPPTTLEFGKAVQQLKDYGWEVEQIMPYVPSHIKLKGPNFAKRYIKDAVDLHNAPQAVKKAVREGVDGVKVSAAAAVAVARKNPLQAEQVLKEQAAKAKAAGKTEVHRPKTEPKTVKETKSLLQIGDTLAELVLAEETDWDQLQRTARSWQRARK